MSLKRGYQPTGVVLLSGPWMGAVLTLWDVGDRVVMSQGFYLALFPQGVWSPGPAGEVGVHQQKEAG